MGTCLLALSLALFCAFASAQRSSTSGQSRQDGVDQRGDHVMGFSHDSTTQHFHLLKDGGDIVVTANDPKDTASIEQTRMHLNHIVSMFSNGNFNAPMVIHDTNPPGVATMIRLKSDIRYTLSEIPQRFASKPQARELQMRCMHSCCFKSWTKEQEMLPRLGARGGYREPTKLLRPSGFISSRRRLEYRLNACGQLALLPVFINFT